MRSPPSVPPAIRRRRAPRPRRTCSPVWRLAVASSEPARKPLFENVSVLPGFSLRSGLMNVVVAMLPPYVGVMARIQASLLRIMRSGRVVRCPRCIRTAGSTVIFPSGDCIAVAIVAVRFHMAAPPHVVSVYDIRLLLGRRINARRCMAHARNRLASALISAFRPSRSAGIRWSSASISSMIVKSNSAGWGLCRVSFEMLW